MEILSQEDVSINCVYVHYIFIVFCLDKLLNTPELVKFRSANLQNLLRNF